MAGFETVVEVLKAVGEPTRLRLVALLAEGELSVKDLTAILGQSQPRVSRHLRLLADAGLVRRHAEGAWAYYGLARDGAAAELALLILAELDPQDPERLTDRARLDAVRAAREGEAAQYFAKVAESWDRLRRLHVPEAAVEEAIVDALGGRPIDTLLDLGTGTGRMLALLADRYRQGVGIDRSREMIAVARANLAAAAVGHAQVLLGDIAGEDTLRTKADVIVLHQVLHYFDDPGRLLGHARGALNPGGEMVVVDFAPHGHEFLRDEHAHRRLGISVEQMAGWAAANALYVAERRDFPSASADEGLTVSLWHLVDAERRAG